MQALTHLTFVNTAIKVHQFWFWRDFSTGKLESWQIKVTASRYIVQKTFLGTLWNVQDKKRPLN